MPLLKEKLLNAKKWKINEYILLGLATRYLHNDKQAGKLIQKVFKLNGYSYDKPDKLQYRLIAPVL